nr:GNAT family N-acetyltransferase [Bacillus solitudinis]
MKSINNSALCFGVYHLNSINKEKKQIGFARVISDLVTHAYLQDVFILSSYRKKGLGKWLLGIIINDEKLNIRRLMCCTEDGQSFYSQFGFSLLDKPSLFMQIKGKGAI